MSIIIIKKDSPFISIDSLTSEQQRQCVLLQQRLCVALHYKLISVALGERAPHRTSFSTHSESSTSSDPAEDDCELDKSHLLLLKKRESCFSCILYFVSPGLLKTNK